MIVQPKRVDPSCGLEWRQGTYPVDGASSGTLSCLHGDERAALSPPAFGEGRRLHRCQRGHITILVLFMGLVFYALAAMTWNTGVVSNAKIETQTAADAAAYSSAVWTSRAVNMITATNMSAMREASAGGMATTMGLTLGVVAVLLAVQTASAISMCTNPFTLIPGLIKLGICIKEWVVFATVAIDCGWPVSCIQDAIAMGDHLADIRDFQEGVVAAIPGLIQAEVGAFEDYYDCDIQLFDGYGKNTPIKAPLWGGSMASSAVPFTVRYSYDFIINGESYGQDDRIKTGMNMMGKSKMTYLGLGFLSGLGWGIALGEHHHVLSTQSGFLESGPHQGGWEDYTVIARAEKRLENSASGQRPASPLAFHAPGVFAHSDPMQPVAFAQAETFNGIDGLIGSGTFGDIITAYPWKVWTDWGWQWQPRLTKGVLVTGDLFGGTSVSAGVDQLKGGALSGHATH